MSKIEKVLSLFSEKGIEIPSDELILRIQKIDEAIKCPPDLLKIGLAYLEMKSCLEWTIGTEKWWSDFSKLLAPLPENDGKDFINKKFLQKIHDERVRVITNIFKNDPVMIEDGGLKDFKRAKEKIDKRKVKNCPDLSRVRIICKNLKDLENAYHKLLSFISLKQLANFNHYYTEEHKKYPTPFRGVNMVFMDENDNSVSTEVQLVTKRVRDVSDLDHPFNVSKLLEYPDKETEDFIYSLMLKASVLDSQEAFGRFLE